MYGISRMISRNKYSIWSVIAVLYFSLILMKASIHNMFIHSNEEQYAYWDHKNECSSLPFMSVTQQNMKRSKCPSKWRWHQYVSDLLSALSCPIFFWLYNTWLLIFSAVHFIPIDLFWTMMNVFLTRRLS